MAEARCRDRRGHRSARHHPHLRLCRYRLALCAQASAALGEVDQAQPDLRAREIGRTQRLDCVIFRRRSDRRAHRLRHRRDTPQRREQLSPRRTPYRSHRPDPVWRRLPRTTPCTTARCCLPGRRGTPRRPRHASPNACAPRPWSRRVRFEIEALVWLASPARCLGRARSRHRPRRPCHRLSLPAGVIHPFVAAGPSVLPLIALAPRRRDYAPRSPPALPPASPANPKPLPARRTPAPASARSADPPTTGIKACATGRDRGTVADFGGNGEVLFKRIYEALGKPDACAG